MGKHWTLEKGSTCDKCGKKFTKQGLRGHAQLVHGAPGPLAAKFGSAKAKSASEPSRKRKRSQPNNARPISARSTSAPSVSNKQPKPSTTTTTPKTDPLAFLD